LDLKVPKEPLKLRVSSPDRKGKELATILGSESTTSNGATQLRLIQILKFTGNKFK
jgi:hypothetical protein